MALVSIKNYGQFETNNRIAMLSLYLFKKKFSMLFNVDVRVSLRVPRLILRALKLTTM